MTLTFSRLYSYKLCKDGLSQILRLMAICLGVSTPSIAQDNAAVLYQQMEERLSYLEKTIANLKGKVEEMDKKLRDGTAPTTKAASPETPVAVGAPTSQTTKGTTEQSSSARELYDQGRRHLNLSSYREAEIVFMDLVALFPQDLLVINAHYWLGEIHLYRKDYKAAVESFGRSYGAYEKLDKKSVGDVKDLKASDTLLKMAFALRGQRKHQEVCAVLAQLKTEFPKAFQKNKAIAREAAQDMKCPRSLGVYES